MPPKMFFNPATGQYEYGEVETPTTGGNLGGTVGGSVPDGVTPGAIGRYTGASGTGVLDDYYDPNWEAAQANATAAQNQADIDYTDQLNQLNEMMNPQFQQLGQSHTQDAGRLGMQMALNGMLRSSNYGQALGRLDTDYQNQQGALQNQLNQTTQSLARQKLGTKNQALADLRTAEGAHADFVTNKKLAQAQEQARIDAQNKAIQTTPTGQLIGVMGPTSAGPGPTGEGLPLQAIADRMLNDWTQNIGMVDQSPLMMETARNSFQRAGENTPGLASILQGPTWEAIRRRLGL